MPADVFLSYTRDEIDVARRFAHAIELAGLSVWWDQALKSGESYDEVTEAALREARAVVVLWSRRSTGSRWVRSEATVAQRQGTLVPVMIEPCERPVMFELVQTLDLSDWLGDPEHPGLKTLLGDLRGRITGDSSSPSPVDLALGTNLRLPVKPSIAVLPFAELSGEDRDHFADGMTEEIAVALARFSSLFVIAGQSSLSYRGTTKPAQAIARELGVRYLLEGSVRRAGGQIRIAVKLVDAPAGEQIWAERFDDGAEDIFALQDRVAGAVASAIDVSISEAEMRRSIARPTRSPGAHEHASAAHVLINRYAPDTVAEALVRAEAARAADPQYAWPVALKAVAHGIRFLNRWVPDRDAEREAAWALGQEALRLGPNEENVLAFVAGMMMNTGADLGEAARLAEQAMAINPTKATVLFWAAWADVEQGNATRGLDRFEKALRINPRSPLRPFTLTGMGNCLFFLGRFKEAAVVQEEVLRLLPNYPPTLLVHLLSCAMDGRLAEARAGAEQLQKFGGLEQTLYYFRNRDQRKRLREVWTLVETEAAA
jgi:TolB-like protein